MWRGPRRRFVAGRNRRRSPHSAARCRYPFHFQDLIPMTTHDAALTRGSIDHDWFESFFSGLFLDVWRQATPPEQTRAEVDFLERTLVLPSGARVLDVACGLGRHSLELAARGHGPMGVDASGEALERARAEAAVRGVRV